MPSGSWSFLLLCLPLVRGLSSFPENMKWAKVGQSVTLTCHTDFDGKVTWKHPLDGEPLSGKTFEVHNFDTPHAGEYSCWDGDQKLNSTYLLEEDDTEEEPIEELLNCAAQTYSCSFTCRWLKEGFSVARLSYHRDGHDSTTTVYSNTHGGQEAFEFTLNLTSSPFAEESAPLVLTGEAVSSTHYVKMNQQLFLRDIITPDPPQLVRCEKQGRMISVTVQAATSWAQPLSYFPLAHQIEFIYQNDGKTGQSNSTMVPQGISKMRARSRDPFVPSPWSQWSPWKNVAYQKKKKRGRIFGENDTIYCKGTQRREKQRKRKQKKNS